MARILIVDGDVVSRTVIRTLLEDSRHSVEEARSALQALDKMERELPDLVLTELYLDGMEGIQFLREVQRRWPDEQVVVMAGGSWIGMTNLMSLTKLLGAAGFLRKPIDGPALGTMVDGLLAS